MPLRENQLGRWGQGAHRVLGSPATYDADRAAAHLLCSDGPVASCATTLADRLMERGWLGTGDVAWKTWTADAFPAILGKHGLDRSRLLACACPERPGEDCWHELLPPAFHVTLRYVCRVPGRPRDSREGTAGDILDNTVVNAAGEVAVWASVLPHRLYIVDASGEILIGSEDARVVKHASLSAGLPVWAAGEVGFRNGRIAVVDFASGHYLKSLAPDRQARLGPFVEEVFKGYTQHFKCPGLEPSFCVRI